MSAPRPYVTEPFRPLSSLIVSSNSYIYNSILVISSCGTFKCVLRMMSNECGCALAEKHSCLWFIAIISLVFLHMVRAGA